MEFRITYLQAMREQNPRMFNQLARSGAMPAHLKQKTAEAYQMREELLVGVPTNEHGTPIDPAAVKLAEEQVFAVMLDFPANETT